MGFVLSGVSPARAQRPAFETPSIDSLKQILNANKKLKVSKKLLLKNTFDLANYYRLTNPDSAIHYFEVAQVLADEAHVDTLKGFLNVQLGNLYLAKGMPNTALEYFFRNYKYYQKAEDPGATAFSLCDIGNTYFANNLYNVAQVYYRKALNIFLSIDHKFGLSVIYNNLGMTNSVQDNLDSALYFYQKALDLRKQMNDPFLVIHTRAYIAELYLKLKEPEEALKIIDESLYTMNNVDLPYNEETEYRVALHILKGKAWEMLNNFSRAEENFHAAIKLAQGINSKFLMSELYLLLAKLEADQGGNEKARQHALYALQLSNEGKNWDIHRKTLYFLGYINEKFGDTDASSKYFKKALHYTDSLLRETSKTKLSDVAKSIELFNLQLEQEKERARFQRIIVVWVAVAVILFIIVIGFIAFYRLQARSRRELENLANASFEGIFIHDHGKIIHLNKKAEEFFGLPAAGLKEKSLRELIAPRFEINFEELWDSDSESNYQADIIRPDGSKLEVEVLSKPFQYKKKRLRVAAVRDLTRIARLTRDNIILWTAAEQMPDMLMITDLEGHILYVNKAFEEVTGYYKEEILGSNPNFLKSGFHPPEFFKNMWDTLAEEKIWTGEIFNRRKNGELFWARTVISPVKDEMGVLRYYVSVSEDITIEKNATLELQRKDMLYRQLASNLPGSAVFLIDKNWVYVLAEGSALHDLGLKSSDFENKPVFDFDVSPQENQLKDILEDVFMGKEITYQAAILDKVYQIIMTPLRENNGEINLILLLMQDITESLQRENQLKESEAKLKKLLETKNRFISILAHDLRNPFSSILGFSDLLYSQYNDYDDKQRHEFISHIRESAETTLKFINSLISWSKSIDENIEPQKEPIPISDLVTEVSEVVEFMAQQKKITINLEYDQDGVVVSDRNMLSTILRNLLTNAVKYSYTESSVVLKIAPSPDGLWLDFKVIDTGVGISKESLAGLFEINKSRSTLGTANEKGSGLGLLIVKEMTAKLGGELLVESSVGVGTVFTLRIPLSN